MSTRGTLLAAALDDVGRYRHRGSDDLAPERRMLHRPDLPSDPVSIESHRMRFLPDFELLEIRHVRIMPLTQTSRVSFRAWESRNPPHHLDPSVTLASRIYASATSHL